MKIFFEDYHYSKDLLDEHCKSFSYHTMKDGKVSLSDVGYCFSSEINDTVFVLPKVFLNQYKMKDGKEELQDVNEDKKDEKTVSGLRAFGKYDPEEIVDLKDDKKHLLDPNIKALIFGLSAWIYRAIKHFDETHPDNKIVKKMESRNVLSVKGKKSETLIDIILELIRFNHEHQNLFTFIAKLSNKGRNRINWTKTINNTQPIFQDDTPCYINVKNKRKEINTDEELIVLFYSVLNYVHETLLFKIEKRLNYDIIKKDVIEKMIKNGKGTRRLKQIRKNYFSDEMVKLWNLLYVYFDHAEQIASNKINMELLTVSNFNVVFEAMIDQLIGDNSVDDVLKYQYDGKIVDHIYKDDSLVHGNGHEIIYYVADSKYYRETSGLGTNSIYKQFTYAKNIIQYNIDILNLIDKDHKMPDGMIYRDEETEGYNITPNFYIRGKIDMAHLDKSKMNLNAEIDKDHKHIIRENYHFENRLFDRDTLLTKEYNINFLFVLASYVKSNSDVFLKSKIRERFKEDMIKLYDSRYHFRLLKLKDSGNTDIFLKKSMRGKVFGFGNGTYLFAYRSLKACEENDEQLKSWLWDFEEQMVDYILQLEGVDKDFGITHYSLKEKEDVDWYGIRNEGKLYKLSTDPQLRKDFVSYVNKAIQEKKEVNIILKFPDMKEEELKKVFLYYADDLIKNFKSESQITKEEGQTIPLDSPETIHSEYNREEVNIYTKLLERAADERRKIKLID